MPSPLSRDLRERIIIKHQKGVKPLQIQKELEIKSLSAVCGIIKLYNETGGIEPRPLKNGRPPKMTAQNYEALKAAVLKQPDITLEELREQLNLPVCISRICRILNNKLDLPRKKTLFPENQNRPDVIKRRDAWKKAFWGIVSDKLVFLDESGVNLAETRLYGRAPSSERINGYVPDAGFERKSVLVSLKLNGQMPSLLFSGTLNGKLFIQYIKQFLSQILTEGDIVIPGNCTAHKVSGVKEAIEACGAKVLYLPAYSPDFNPAELLWSKVKAILRREKARTFETLQKALKLALDSVSSGDICGWFKHCGYYVC